MRLFFAEEKRAWDYIDGKLPLDEELVAEFIYHRWSGLLDYFLTESEKKKKKIDFDYLIDGLESILFFAVVNNRKDELKVLLKHSADPNSREESGDTLLIAAVRVRHVTIADILLAHGADAAAVGEDEMTAMDRAKENNHQRMVQLLQAYVKKRID